MLRILFTSAGRRVELLGCFRAAARELGISAEIFACDADPRFSAACNLADRAFAVPRCDHPEYAISVLGIARDNGIQLVIPTIDPELLPLARAVHDFQSGGIRLHVSDVKTVSVAQDKMRTAILLKERGIPVPPTYSAETVRGNSESLPWPLFMKPVSGSASRGLRLVRSTHELEEEFSEPMLFQKYLEGKEYTANIFIDANGVMKCAVAHERLQVRAGEVEKGVTVRSKALESIAYSIADALPEARGVLCFQVIDDVELGPCVIEINARFGGGYPLVHKAGAKFARWLIEECTGLPRTACNDWQAGVTMLRYDASVFCQNGEK
jgi:carbamoyl-phosphate synthase large subunit